jgi:hypothetical protein
MPNNKNTQVSAANTNETTIPSEKQQVLDELAKRLKPLKVADLKVILVDYKIECPKKATKPVLIDLIMKEAERKASLTVEAPVKTEAVKTEKKTETKTESKATKSEKSILSMDATELAAHLKGLKVADLKKILLEEFESEPTAKVSKNDLIELITKFCNSKRKSSETKTETKSSESKAETEKSSESKPELSMSEMTAEDLAAHLKKLKVPDLKLEIANLKIEGVPGKSSKAQLIEFIMKHFGHEGNAVAVTAPKKKAKVQVDESATEYSEVALKAMSISLLREVHETYYPNEDVVYKKPEMVKRLVGKSVLTGYTRCDLKEMNVKDLRSLYQRMTGDKKTVKKEDMMTALVGKEKEEGTCIPKTETKPKKETKPKTVKKEETKKETPKAVTQQPDKDGVYEQEEMDWIRGTIDLEHIIYINPGKMGPESDGAWSNYDFPKVHAEISKMIEGSNTSSTSTNTYTEQELKVRNVEKLKALCKELGIKEYEGVTMSKLKKPKLMEAIRNCNQTVTSTNHKIWVAEVDSEVNYKTYATLEDLYKDINKIWNGWEDAESASEFTESNTLRDEAPVIVSEGAREFYVFSDSETAKKFLAKSEADIREMIQTRIMMDSDGEYDVKGDSTEEEDDEDCEDDGTETGEGTEEEDLEEDELDMDDE